MDKVVISGSAITGLGNTEWDISGDYSKSDKAATESQLFQATEGVLRYDKKADGSFDYGQLTLAGAAYAGKAGGGTRIVNVAYASGNNGSEAVNVDYLNDKLDGVKGDIATGEKHIQEGKYEIKNDDVTLNVVDGNGTKVGDVIIKDVASASDLDRVEGKVDAVDKKVGDLDALHKDIKGESVVDSMNKIDDKLNGIAGDLEKVGEEAGKHSSVSNGDGNISINETTNGKGGVNYEVGLSDNVNINNSLTVGGEDGVKITEGNITGLENKNWNPDEIVSGQAATEDQLKAATEGMISYDKVDGKLDTSKITLAENKQDDKVIGTTIANVADGKIAEGSKDAINGGQLFEAKQEINNSIQNLGNSISSVNGRVSKVGSGAAALAALHPLAFDPEDKLNFAAGCGNYGGSTATSIGAFYQPTEKMLLSVAGTYGNGENMVNMGVSFALDKKSNVSNTRVAMAKELVALREHMVKQDQQILSQSRQIASQNQQINSQNQQLAVQGQQIAQLLQIVNKLTGEELVLETVPVAPTSAYFPDVPENHWAYDYVNELAKAGILEGYEDGNFKGDKQMTRYEFASMLYKAMAQGVVLDTRLAEEFKAELGHIRVDVVKKAKQNGRAIERVRVNQEA